MLTSVATLFLTLALADPAAKPQNKPQPNPALNIPKPSPPPKVPAALANKAKLSLLTRDTNEAVGLVAVPGEKPGRLFIVEKRGVIRILRGTAVNPTPFLDVSARVKVEKRDNGEQGLLGLAFHPQYARNGFFYINYTDLKGDTRVVEMHADKINPNRAESTIDRELLFVHQPYANHNAGNLAFGPDGKLYVLMGDGGAAKDPHGNGQNPDTRLGKALRIDVQAATPVVEVIAKGLRNPWRYSFDHKTGDVYIADVGQDIYEWIHFLPAGNLTGHNLGWNIREGLHCFQDKPCDPAPFKPPVIEYPHSEGCSITGGYVYRGKALPELDGAYFFTDYCTAILRSFRMKGGKVTDSWDWKDALDPDAKLARLAAWGEDQDGELYLVSHEGPIYKLERR